MDKFKRDYERYDECINFGKNHNPMIVKSIKSNTKIDFYIVISNLLCVFLCTLLSLFTFHNLYWLILINLALAFFFGKQFFTVKGKKNFQLYWFHSYKDLLAIKKQFYKNPQLVKDIFNSMIAANYPEETIKQFIEEVEKEDLSYKSIQLAYQSLPDIKPKASSKKLYDELMTEHKSKDNINFFEKNK